MVLCSGENHCGFQRPDVGGTVFADPRVADGELVKAEHVQHAHTGDGGAEKLGILVMEAPTRKPPLSPLMASLVWTCISRREGTLGPSEVVKDILLVVQQPA